MAEKKTGTKSTASKSEPVAKKLVTRNYMKPRGIKGKFITGTLNAKDFKVAYNKTVEIDPDVAEIIDWSLATQEFADEYIEKMEQEPEADE